MPENQHHDHLGQEYMEEEEYDDDDEEEEENTDEEGPPLPNSFKDILAKFSEDWLSNEVHHKVSKVATSDFWNICSKYMFSITEAFTKEKKKKFPKFEHIRRKLKKEKVPKIHLKTGFVNKETQELSIENTEKLPVLQYPQDKFEKVFEIAHVKVLKRSLQLRVSCQ